MEQYISKSALVAEIERRINTCLNRREEMIIADCETLVGDATARAGELQCLKDYIESLGGKEVDLKKEIKEHIDDEWSDEWSGDVGNWIRWQRGTSSMTVEDVKDIAKHFFELGLNASNPVAEVNLESLVRQVIDLNLEAGEHYNNIIKEERKEYGGSDLAINLFCGTIDAKELGIKYILDKLKAQKGEEV